ncbi:MAG TPA: hypothetical protein VHZ33_10470 [Trebonia sp.]|nr:hypothetical protein [Trebonia sp.]
MPKHIADTSPITTPADRVDRPDSAARNPVRDPTDPTNPADPTALAPADPDVATDPPTARTVVIRPPLVTQ